MSFGVLAFQQQQVSFFFIIHWKIIVQGTISKKWSKSISSLTRQLVQSRSMTSNHNTSGRGDGGADSSSSDEDFDPEMYPQMNPDLSMPGSTKPMITVLVTGFGPFGDHTINASWEAVKELRKMGVTHNVKLITHEIPVEYQTVKQLIPNLWNQHSPDLVVHVGVSSIAEEVTIETYAHNECYNKQDVTGNTAPSECYQKNGRDCLETGFDVAQLCMDINNGSCLAMAVPSKDAGRYLCEYTFYASLSQKSSCVAFIHVPPLGSPYSSVELGDALRCAIQSMLKQLNLYHPLPLPSAELMDQIKRNHDGALCTQ